MTWRCAVGMALIAATSLTACDSLLTRPSRYNSVTVATLRRDGVTAIPGADVILYTGARPMGYGTTDSTGHFTFTRVPQGVYGVQAFPPDGYGVVEDFIRAPLSTVVDGLNVADDTVSPVRFTFLKKGSGTVSVQVKAVGGGNLTGVPVDLYEPLKVDAHAVTDSTGAVTFKNVSYGVHGVIVTRPFLYRDFVRVDDSVSTSRDNLIVDDGSSTSLVIPITKCAGAIRAKIVDQNGAPVPLTTAVMFTFRDQLKLAQSGPDGTITFTDAPCAWQLGVAINPPLGYTVGQGRGLNVLDGIQVANGATTNIQFVVQKQ